VKFAVDSGTIAYPTVYFKITGFLEAPFYERTLLGISTVFREPESADSSERRACRETQPSTFQHKTVSFADVDVPIGRNESGRARG